MSVSRGEACERGPLGAGGACFEREGSGCPHALQLSIFLPLAGDSQPNAKQQVPFIMTLALLSLLYESYIFLHLAHFTRVSPANLRIHLSAYPNFKGYLITSAWLNPSTSHQEERYHQLFLRRRIYVAQMMERWMEKLDGRYAGTLNYYEI